MNLKHILSDKFVDFSAKVTNVHGKIKDLKAKFQSELKALTDEAEDLNVDFQAWLKEQEEATKTLPANNSVIAPKKEVKNA